MLRLDSEIEGLDPAVARAQQRTGTVLDGKWHLDALLGVGGMAAVYAATHRNGTRAAIKVLHPELGGFGHVRSRFLKEGYVGNKIEHPGVVRVLDDDTADDGSLYLVMDLLDGESLEARRARKGGSLVVDEVLSVADQVLDVLAAAHDKGVVHRDIKPENIFLTRQGAIKVLDFGIARLRELSTTSSATQAGTTMGTPAFMAPEHARGLWDEVDAQSDLWSVGATMFTLATGKLVHEARTPNEQLVAAVTQPARPLQAVAASIPLPLAEVVDTALAFQKADRFPDARTMQEAVRTAYDRIRHVPIHSYPPLAVTDFNEDAVTTVAKPEFLRPSPTTGAEGVVTSGKTDVPLRTQPRTAVPPSYVIAGGAAAGVVILLVVVALAAFVGSRGSPAASSSASPPSAPAVALAPESPQPSASPAASEPRAQASAPPVLAAPGSSAPILSINDLPSAKPRVPKVSTSAPKPPAVPAAPPTADWKDKRR